MCPYFHLKLMTFHKGGQVFLYPFYRWGRLESVRNIQLSMWQRLGQCPTILTLGLKAKRWFFAWPNHLVSTWDFSSFGLHFFPWYHRIRLVCILSRFLLFPNGQLHNVISPQCLEYPPIYLEAKWFTDLKHKIGISSSRN